MKYLTDYSQEGITKALKEHKAFYAFNNTQFEEQKDKEETNYVHMGNGLYAPKEKADSLYATFLKVIKTAREQDLAENGKTIIIQRELLNHECYYLGDYSEIIDNMSEYGISEEEIKQVFLQNKENEQVY